MTVIFPQPKTQPDAGGSDVIPKGQDDDESYLRIWNALAGLKNLGYIRLQKKPNESESHIKETYILIRVRSIPKVGLQTVDGIFDLRYVESKLQSEKRHHMSYLIKKGTSSPDDYKLSEFPLTREIGDISGMETTVIAQEKVPSVHTEIWNQYTFNDEDKTNFTSSISTDSKKVLTGLVCFFKVVISLHNELPFLVPVKTHEGNNDDSDDKQSNLCQLYSIYLSLHTTLRSGSGVALSAIKKLNWVNRLPSSEELIIVDWILNSTGQSPTTYLKVTEEEQSSILVLIGKLLRVFENVIAPNSETILQTHRYYCHVFLSRLELLIENDVKSSIDIDDFFASPLEFIYHTSNCLSETISGWPTTGQSFRNTAGIKKYAEFNIKQRMIIRHYIHNKMIAKKILFSNKAGDDEMLNINKNIFDYTGPRLNNEVFGHSIFVKEKWPPGDEYKRIEKTIPDGNREQYNEWYKPSYNTSPLLQRRTLDFTLIQWCDQIELTNQPRDPFELFNDILDGNLDIVGLKDTHLQQIGEYKPIPDYDNIFEFHHFKSSSMNKYAKKRSQAERTKSLIHSDDVFYRSITVGDDLGAKKWYRGLAKVTRFNNIRVCSLFHQTYHEDNSGAKNIGHKRYKYLGRTEDQDEQYIDLFIPDDHLLGYDISKIMVRVFDPIGQDNYRKQSQFSGGRYYETYQEPRDSVVEVKKIDPFCDLEEQPKSFFANLNKFWRSLLEVANLSATDKDNRYSRTNDLRLLGKDKTILPSEVFSIRGSYFLDEPTDDMILRKMGGDIKGPSSESGAKPTLEELRLDILKQWYLESDSAKPTESDSGKDSSQTVGAGPASSDQNENHISVSLHSKADLNTVYDIVMKTFISGNCIKCKNTRRAALLWLLRLREEQGLLSAESSAITEGREVLCDEDIESSLKKDGKLANVTEKNKNDVIASSMNWTSTLLFEIIAGQRARTHQPGVLVCATLVLRDSSQDIQNRAEFEEVRI